MGEAVKFDKDYRRELLDALPGELAAKLGALGLRHRRMKCAIWSWRCAALRHWRAEELSVYCAAARNHPPELPAPPDAGRAIGDDQPG